ncbi:sigma 54-interacting transcriptional regulator [Fusobacterium simiae]|uniref:Sigma 54-interacting transcriptional regulator n=1 Tax=Fusobacterium simiae TaxID=855 RepID=A0ABT4DKJ5_FUSSI|nr:sigma 54-interacting transcriptional regulator [Fusobacterium simiae]MCY7009130.1 sigma 54-interacting transcriptional regulator [Fusobacterium simiae]
MQIFDKIFENLSSIDGITIINLNGDILFSAKFNNQLHNYNGNYEMVGKNFKDIYPKLSSKNSTLLQCIELGKPIYIESQKLEFYDGHCIFINSLSIPIRHGGKIVGAIDISTEDFKENLNSELYNKKENYIPIEEQQFNDIIRKLGNRTVNTKYKINDIITDNIEMIRMKKFIKEICDFDISVLITGETGTGKELIAHSLHTESKRCNKPFIVQNCAAIPENLFESIFFGTVKGAFTDSIDNMGLFEMANGGTLFLDEINSMPIYLQSKLLRVLQDKKITRLGSKRVIDVDVRLITAMNKDPIKAIADKELRQDLYYRIGMLKIDVLPLRKRKEDILLLTQYFISKYNITFSKNIKGISKDLYRKFKNYDWFGNVRELDNLLLLAISMVDKNKEILELSDIIFSNNIQTDEKTFSVDEVEKIGIKNLLDQYEKNIIKITLEKYDYNITKTADALKIPRQTLHRKIKIYQL